jgi:cytochrome P450
LLNKNWKNYEKDQDEIIMDGRCFDGSKQSVIGHGLLLANGELWDRQRALMNPAFKMPHMRATVPTFLEQASILVDKWEDR